MRKNMVIAVLLLLGSLNASTIAPAVVRARPGAARLRGAPGCPIFPASNVWNQDISGLPVAADSARLIGAIGLHRGLQAAFGPRPTQGISVVIVSAHQPRLLVRFIGVQKVSYALYPIPANLRAGTGPAAHLLLVDRDACRLYELHGARWTSHGWQAVSGATWDLRSNALPPAGWPSADAAGLPILPGLVRYDEVAAGAINHALRFTAPNTRNMHIYPARHDAGVADATLPPMGLRVRLKASVDISGFSPQARVVLQCLKTYGMMLADNGSPWYITGAPNPNWNDDDLHHLNQITGADLEVVDTSNLVNGP